MKVLVTGGMGYVGSQLIPELLADGHEVVAYDLGWFGDGFLPRDNEKLKMVFADIRDRPSLRAALHGVEAVIHLACVSNDHSCQLDEALSTSINYDAFEPLVLAAKQAGVRRFIYCSSSSVYGVSDALEVTEDHPLVPLTLYNRYKGMCEPILLKHKAENFECIILRPATVCGYAPRMRFDLTVNIITAHAALNREITVFGGKQQRPNLHIKDMCRAYRTMLAAMPAQVNGRTFNIGQENLTVARIAEIASEETQLHMGFMPSIKTTESTDNRSYHISSKRIQDELNFTPALGVRNAMRDLLVRFKSGMWPDALTNPAYTNVKQLVDKGFAVKDSLASFRQDRYAK